MALKITNGIYSLASGGMPREADRKTELLQNALMRLSLQRGSFPYDRELGSRLSELDTSAEHAKETALALANEALTPMAGVTAETATFLSGGRIRFYINTPEGGGNVIYGSI